jgi:SAM-dependent methyltransferase
VQKGKFKNNWFCAYDIMNNVLAVQRKPWIPKRPVSKGASAYHNAVVKAPYYAESLHELVKIIRGNIKEDCVVVDFGAGTGVSAIYLLKHLKFRFKLWLVDNSAAWLGKAYDVFKDNPNVECFLLEKIKGRYATLAETVGLGVADHVLSANTMHLIPNLEGIFSEIYGSLKDKGHFAFQSANIFREGREEGVLMVDDTIKRVHDIALDIVRKDNKFGEYRKDLDENIGAETQQRKLVFPNPRPINLYLKKMKDSGFDYFSTQYKTIRIKYSDWLNFLRVKRLQAGILPEIGGKDSSPKEDADRDTLITIAAKRLFGDLEKNNPVADTKSFATECIFVTAVK